VLAGSTRVTVTLDSEGEGTRLTLRHENLIERLTRAYEAGDIDSIIALFSDDAWLTMPPLPLEYQRRDLIARFLTAIAFRDGRTYRLVPTRADGQLAFAPTCAKSHEPKTRR
jgi:ketosteroid isomerase-like protein